MSVLADRASGAGVLDRLQVLRSAPTPLRGAPAATWPPSPRTGVRQLRVAGPGLQPWLQDTTTTRTDPAGSTLATPVLGPRNGVHLPSSAMPFQMAPPGASTSAAAAPSEKSTYSARISMTASAVSPGGTASSYRMLKREPPWSRRSWIRACRSARACSSMTLARRLSRSRSRRRSRNSPSMRRLRAESVSRLTWRSSSRSRLVLGARGTYTLPGDGSPNVP